MVGAVRPAGRAGLHGPRAGQRRRERAPRASTGCTTASSATRWTRAPSIKVKITVDKEKREATVDFTGTSPQQRDQLQRARAGDARRRALRVPRHGRRRHPDERRLPAADQHRHPEELDAVAANIRPPSSPATSRPRRPSPTACSARSARMAAAQGTMNNLTFGNATLSVLRDDLLGLAGRARASTAPTRVHTHMTNTRLTDPEILEFRYPVLLEDFHIRKGSGGKRQMERGRRHPPHHPLPGEDGLRHPVRPPPRARRSGSPAARPARSARTGCAARTAASSGCRAATPPCSTPARRSSSRRRPRAVMATRATHDRLAAAVS